MQLGFNSQIIVMPETSYPLTGDDFVPLTDFDATMTAHNNIGISYELGKQQINQVVRSGNLGRSACEIKPGREMPKVTLTGKLSAENSAWIFPAITLDTAKAGDAVGTAWAVG